MGKAADLAAQLEAQVAAGELGAGDLLPPENELAAAHHMARNTVRAALGDLGGRGLIEPEKGIGWRVPRRVVLDVHLTRDATRVVTGQEPTRGADSWMFDVTSLGHEAEERLRIYAGETDLGEPAVIRELLRLAAGRKHNRARWWFPRWVADGTPLAGPDPVDGGSIPYLARTLPEGDLALAPVMFTWRMPTPDEAGELAIPAGVPVGVETRRGYTISGPVFYSETIWPGDRTRLIAEV